MSGLYDYRQLDPLLLSRIRLAAMTLLATLDTADFSYLKTQTGASDGNLGAHMQKLKAAGYVREHKRFRNGKPNTRYRITDRGERALSDYLARLAAMTGGKA